MSMQTQLAIAYTESVSALVSAVGPFLMFLSLCSSVSRYYFIIQLDIAYTESFGL
jgi:hypothetical protein